MAKILITGLRAPGSLEWIRALSKEHEVHGMDFVNFPIGKFSNGLESYTKLSSPLETDFKSNLQEYLLKNEFDLIIPTCEEIFHIPPFNEKILASDKIYDLHSKLKFNAMSFSSWQGKMPMTKVKTKAEIQELKTSHLQSFVYKPEYTRFGTEVYISPKNADFVDSHNHENWLEQELILGQEICTYALAYEGKLMDCSFYIPKHRSGKAGIYFEWIKDKKLEEIIAHFIEYHNLHGQISFDIIKKEHDYYFIECNPRMTSGIHNVSHESLRKYVQLVLYKKIYPRNVSFRKDMTPKMLSLLNIGKEGFFDAHDIIFDKSDIMPTLGQVLSTAEVFYRAKRYGLSLVDSTVYDISYPLNY